MNAQIQVVIVSNRRSPCILKFGLCFFGILCQGTENCQNIAVGLFSCFCFSQKGALGLIFFASFVDRKALPTLQWVSTVVALAKKGAFDGLKTHCEEGHMQAVQLPKNNVSAPDGDTVP